MQLFFQEKTEVGCRVVVNFSAIHEKMEREAWNARSTVGHRDLRISCCVKQDHISTELRIGQTNTSSGSRLYNNKKSENIALEQVFTVGGLAN